MGPKVGVIERFQCGPCTNEHLQPAYGGGRSQSSRNPYKKC